MCASVVLAARFRPTIDRNVATVVRRRRGRRRRFGFSSSRSRCGSSASTATQLVAVVFASRKAQCVACLVTGVLCADFLPFHADHLQKTCRPDRFQMAHNFLGNEHFFLFGRCRCVGFHVVLNQLTKAHISLVFGIRLVLAAENIRDGGFGNDPFHTDGSSGHFSGATIFATIASGCFCGGERNGTVITGVVCVERGDVHINCCCHEIRRSQT